MMSDGLRQLDILHPTKYAMHMPKHTQIAIFVDTRQYAIASMTKTPPAAPRNRWRAIRLGPYVWEPEPDDEVGYGLISSLRSCLVKYGLDRSAIMCWKQASWVAGERVMLMHWSTAATEAFV